MATLDRIAKEFAGAVGKIMAADAKETCVLPDGQGGYGFAIEFLDGCRKHVRITQKYPNPVYAARDLQAWHIAVHVGEGHA